MHDDRLHHVQLELSGLGGDRYGQVVADHFERYLVHHFGNHRVYFARHNRRTGLHRRQVDLIQPGTRSRREQTQVVADFRQLDRQPFQRRRVHYKRSSIVGRFNHVGSRHDRQSGDFTQVFDAKRRVIGIGIDTGTDRRRTHVHLKEQLVVLFEPFDLLG